MLASVAHVKAEPSQADPTAWVPWVWSAPRRWGTFNVIVELIYASYHVLSQPVAAHRNHQISFYTLLLC